MADVPSPLPAVVTLRSSLKTIDEQLGSGALSPDRVEDIKSAVDDIRFRLCRGKDGREIREEEAKALSPACSTTA